MCSDGGGVNHPCPWPLAALISGERWSRTRSISNAAGNDTSPAPPGPRPRKGSAAQHSPSITASYCILPPHFLVLAGGLRGEEKKKKTEKKGLYFRFSFVRKSSRKTRRGSLVAFIWDHICWCWTAALSFQASLSVSHRHRHACMLYSCTWDTAYKHMHSWTYK